MNLHIELIHRGDDNWLALATDDAGGLDSDLGVGRGSQRQAAESALRSYFTRKQDKDEAKRLKAESMAARPAWITDTGDFGGPSTELPITGDIIAKIDEARARRTPQSPLFSGGRLDKRVAVSPAKIEELLHEAGERGRVVRISGTKVNGERYVRDVTVYSLTDDRVNVYDIGKSASRTFRLDGIERAEELE
jgi:hypothetical protein